MKSVLYCKQPRNQPGNNSSGILLWKYRYCEGVTATLMAIVTLIAMEIVAAIRTALVIVVVVVAAALLIQIIKVTIIMVIAIKIIIIIGG